jgi:hypothetical protein
MYVAAQSSAQTHIVVKPSMPTAIWSLNGNPAERRLDPEDQQLRTWVQIHSRYTAQGYSRSFVFQVTEHLESSEMMWVHPEPSGAIYVTWSQKDLFACRNWMLWSKIRNSGQKPASRFNFGQ